MEYESVTYRVEPDDHRAMSLVRTSIPSIDQIDHNAQETRVWVRDEDPPGQPRIGQGELHVWMIHLSDDPCICAEEISLLSTDESARAGRFTFARDRRHFIVAHAAMRRLLGRYLRRAPDTVELMRGAFGKPEIVPVPGVPRISFNLSHSHERALLAVTGDAAVGVDCEYVHEGIPIQEVADLFFAEREILQLQVKSREEQLSAFYRCWTRKEALIKGIGTGLSCPLHSFSVEIDTMVAQKPRNEGIPFQIQPEWIVLDVPMDDEYVGAVAIAASGKGTIST